MEGAHSSFESGGCSGRSARGPVVMKFGGTSVEDAAAIRRLVSIVLTRAHDSPVVVVSAMAGVTDELLALGTRAKDGGFVSANTSADNIQSRHLDVVAQLVPVSQRAVLAEYIEAEIAALKALLADIVEMRMLDLRVQDKLLGIGECLASQVVAAALRSFGVKAKHIDARHCIVTNEHHGAANPLWNETNACVQQIVGGHCRLGLVPVLGGFIAATRDGIPTTLGRGGSDFSAAIVGAALGASKIEIWTDVDGIMTADPNVCPDARLLPKISFEEAAQLAYFGAKVLHPATLVPAMRENIPVYVRNSRKPHRACTEITAAEQSPDPVRAIAAKHNVAWLEIASVAPVNAEFSALVCSVLGRHGASVELMSSSCDRLCVLVSGAHSLPAITAELQQHGEVHAENHKALICVVGQNIRCSADVGQTIHAALDDMGIQWLPSAASKNSMSLLIEESRVHESVQRLHKLFFGARRSPESFVSSHSLCQAGESWL
jgi:aspartate kinase